MLLQLWLWMGNDQGGPASAISPGPPDSVLLGSPTHRQQAGPGKTPGLYDTFTVLALLGFQQLLGHRDHLHMAVFLIHTSNCSLGSQEFIHMAREIRDEGAASRMQI